MPMETPRQEARRRAREVRSKHAIKRQEKEKRLEDLAVAVLVALDMRTECEREAGRALAAMIDDEGLTLHDAVEWCGATVSLRTANRLRTLAASSDCVDTSNGETDCADCDNDDVATRDTNRGADAEGADKSSETTDRSRPALDVASTSDAEVTSESGASNGSGVR